MRPLDRIDFEIVGLLQKNARLSNKELAAKVGVAQSTCLERVRRLVEEKVLLGFHARVAHKAMGIGIEAMISVRLTKHSHRLVEDFAEWAVALPFVREVYHMAGANDYLIHVLARDAGHLRELAMTSFTTRPEVEHLETALIFAHQQNRSLPVFAEVEED